MLQAIRSRTVYLVFFFSFSFFIELFHVQPLGMDTTKRTLSHHQSHPKKLLKETAHSWHMPRLSENDIPAQWTPAESRLCAWYWDCACWVMEASLFLTAPFTDVLAKISVVSDHCQNPRAQGYRTVPINMPWVSPKVAQKTVSSFFRIWPTLIPQTTPQHKPLDTTTARNVTPTAPLATKSPGHHESENTT